MNLSDKEQTFLVRGLDKATTADEAETCAKNFFKELRRRGVSGYTFINQMDYAEYEREIDHTEREDDQYEGDFTEKQKREAKAYWQSSRPEEAAPREPSQQYYRDRARPDAGQSSPQEIGRTASKPGRPGAVLTWILMLVSFGTVFLFTHNIIVTLILGWLLSFALYAWRWLRWLVGGLVILYAVALVWPGPAREPAGRSSAPDWRMEQMLERQRYAEEYIRTHPPSKAVIDAVTRAAAAGITTPAAIPSRLSTEPTPMPTPTPWRNESFEEIVAPERERIEETFARERAESDKRIKEIQKQIMDMAQDTR